jgi:hypothetical membrane protein
MITDRWLVRLGLIGPLLFMGGVAVQDIVKPGFDPMRHFVSHLSLGSAGWLNGVLLVITGAAIVGFGIGVNRVGFLGGRWPGRLAALFGWALIAAGLFPIDPGLGFPPNQPTAEPTWHGQLHNIAGAVAFLSITLTMVMGGRAMGSQEDKRRLRHLTFGAAALVVILFVAMSTAVAMDYAGALQQPVGGLLEQLYLAAAMGWILTISLAALHRASDDSPSEVTTSV